MPPPQRQTSTTKTGRTASDWQSDLKVSDCPQERSSHDADDVEGENDIPTGAFAGNASENLHDEPLPYRRGAFIKSLPERQENWSIGKWKEHLTLTDMDFTSETALEFWFDDNQEAIEAAKTTSYILWKLIILKAPAEKRKSINRCLLKHEQHIYLEDIADELVRELYSTNADVIALERDLQITNVAKSVEIAFSMFEKQETAYFYMCSRRRRHQLIGLEKKKRSL